MSQPTVCVVMLVNGARSMTRRAIASFRAQTYKRKRLLIVASDFSENDLADGVLMRANNGSHVFYQSVCNGGTHDFVPFDVLPTDIQANVAAAGFKTIGALRNFAGLGCVAMDADLIAHFDSDDWSHPRRLEEQVALLEASGKQCVGYREMLFWDTRFAANPDPSLREIENDLDKLRPDLIRNRHNEAWLYCNPGRGLCAGGTIMYRRELWERCPFPDAPHEDRRWWSDNQAVSAGYLDASAMAMESPDGPLPLWGPRFIAHIHGGNSETIPRSTMLAGGGVWKRAPEFDSYCAERMKL